MAKKIMCPHCNQEFEETKPWDIKWVRSKYGPWDENEGDPEWRVNSEDELEAFVGQLYSEAGEKWCESPEAFLKHFNVTFEDIKGRGCWWGKGLNIEPVVSKEE